MSLSLNQVEYKICFLFVPVSFNYWAREYFEEIKVTLFYCNWWDQFYKRKFIYKRASPSLKYLFIYTYNDTPYTWVMIRRYVNHMLYYLYILNPAIYKDTFFNILGPARIQTWDSEVKRGNANTWALLHWRFKSL